MTKQLVDIEDALLEQARQALGTGTIKDTVATALRQAVHSSERRTRLNDDTLRRFAMRPATSPTARSWPPHGGRTGHMADRQVSACQTSRLQVREVVLSRVRAGRVAIAIVTELEVGFSARSADDYLTTRETLIDYLLPVFLIPRAEQRSREVQAELVRRRQHRAVSIPDLIVAAVASVEDLTVLHYDADFDLISAVTNQPTEWIVARGSID